MISAVFVGAITGFKYFSCGMVVVKGVQLLTEGASNNAKKAK